jgi:hypothetical protein
VRTNVQAEVQAVFDLDKKALKDLLTCVFSDEKTWLGISAFACSLLNGGATLTAGSAIAALSLFGSKAFKAAADRREKLNASDFRLLYRLRAF